jgi:predicted ATP-grasp superfamily ATP-dependent carboligase
VYSRFAARVLIAPTIKEATQAMTSGPACAWIAQEFMEGRQICTYSIAHKGTLTAHTTYRADFTAGRGAAIVFEHIYHPVIFEWVQLFVSQLGFTGQIAFDFIETSDGSVVALECNPRATSGIHLFSNEGDITRAFLDDSIVCLTPKKQQAAMLSTGMLVYGLPTSLKKRQLVKWLTKFFTSRDVVFDARDPLPFLLQWRSIISYSRLGRKLGISALAASTFDIEWNGELSELTRPESKVSSGAQEK